MKHIEVDRLSEGRLGKDGRLTLAVVAADQQRYEIELPEPIATALWPTLGRHVRTFDPTGRADAAGFSATEAQAVRVALHKPSRRAVLRFDEGSVGELNISLDQGQLARLIEQAILCLGALVKRGMN